MARRLISSGSTFEADIGYSRAVVDDDWVFVSGTTGFDYATMTISDNLLDQTDQCLKNIQADQTTLRKLFFSFLCGKKNIHLPTGSALILTFFIDTDYILSLILVHYQNEHQ